MPTPDSASLLGIGFLLGLRHALDADHLAAVSTVLAQRPSLAASTAVGFWWGVGHTVTLLVVGAAVMVWDLPIPEPLAVAAECGVALLLILLGGSLGLTLYREQWHLHAHHHPDGAHHIHLHRHNRQDSHEHRHWRAPFLRPLCIGMAHGLAGSAALMLLVLSASREVGPGLFSIAIFGLGSIVGMMGIGLTLSLPLVYSWTSSRRLFTMLQGCAGAASFCLGIWMLLKLTSAMPLQ